MLTSESASAFDISARMFPASLDKIQVMARLPAADDIMPIIASLPDSERIRLLRWIAPPYGTDGVAHKVAPPTDEEFSGEDESLACESDGWEEFL